jgi:signal peptidase I
MRIAVLSVVMVIAAALAGCGGGGSTGTTNASAAKAKRLLPESVYRVPSLSMEPTLRIGEKVLAPPGAPKVGAIVVYRMPEGAAEGECGPKPHIVKPGGAACVESLPTPSSLLAVKRVVAGPGDEIYIRAGHVYRKAAGAGSFVREQDSYARPCGTTPECNFPTPIGIPAGEWYLLGDNRGESLDSRLSGAIPTSWIVGVVEKVEKARK